MTEWERCEGGAAINVDHDRMMAQCPRCPYEFSTLMDAPVVPPHWIAHGGRFVRFNPEDMRRG